jgi:hypothetical protein
MCVRSEVRENRRRRSRLARVAPHARPHARYIGDDEKVAGSGPRADRSGEVKAPSLIERQLQGAIAELERLGISHVRISCTECGFTGLTSFFLMRTRGIITENTTFLELARQMRCAKCRKKLSADSVRPVHQAHAAGTPAARKLRRDSL